MKIAGWQKCSFVDYPGSISVTLFTPGCNMQCYFCHNRTQLLSESPTLIPTDKVMAFLRTRSGLISSVVISGGEPTLQPGLEEFIAEVKSLGYRVKLDTNGSRPDRLRKLIDADLFDYVAMDLKAPLDKLRRVIGCDIPFELLKQSIDILLQNRVDYEFRTTVLPEFDYKDVMEIGSSISGARYYALQQFREPEQYQDSNVYRLTHKPHPAAFFLELQEELLQTIEQVVIRGINGQSKAQPSFNEASI